jgi:para-nitrobenzyl esterase
VSFRSGDVLKLLPDPKIPLLKSSDQNVPIACGDKKSLPGMILEFGENLEDLSLPNVRRWLAFFSRSGVAVASAPALAAPGGTLGKKANGPTISTTDGPVRGFVENGVAKFLGIPYAAPPVDDLRWMPPQASAKHALLDATQFANTCPQVTELGAFAGPSSTTEDCLYLNVFMTGTSPAKPVLVWLHGGGNVDGETNDYDASKLAQNGIIVVTVNYRLGLFGFLSEQHLNSEGNPWGY